MSLPETLRQSLAAARSMIGRAHAFDVRLQAGNAKAMLANACAFVPQEPLIGNAFEEARLRIDAFYVASELEDARQSALQAIDSLKLSLAHARPNEHAKALGVDWF